MRPEQDTYQLTIYTWPAFRGTPVDLRTSEHPTPEAARACLDVQTASYAYATLSRAVPERGWLPCNWEGHLLFGSEDWPVVCGKNGEHPLYLEYLADRQYLKAETKRRYLAQPKGSRRGTGEIVCELVRERHPGLSGVCDNLAWEVAGEIRG